MNDAFLVGMLDCMADRLEQIKSFASGQFIGVTELP